MDQAGTIAAMPRRYDNTGHLEDWQDAGKWFHYGNHAIFSRMEGRGDALLLIHGFPTSSWDWHRLWPFLTARFQVLVTDMIGFGFSDKPSDYPYSIVDATDLQQGWLEQLGVERVHILAHDYGCSVAQELLARDQEGQLPFTIASASFLNGGLFPEVHRPLLIQNLLTGRLGGLFSRMITRRVFEANMLRVFGPDTRPSQSELDDFWQLLLYNNGRGVIHRLLGYMEERRCHRNRWVGALQRATQPLQLISGSVDPVAGQGTADRFAELLPDARLVRLHGIGHFPHYEVPGMVWQAFRDGLQVR